MVYFLTIWEQLCLRMNDVENQRNNGFAQLSNSSGTEKYIYTLNIMIFINLLSPD